MFEHASHEHLFPLSPHLRVSWRWKEKRNKPVMDRDICSRIIWRADGGEVPSRVPPWIESSDHFWIARTSSGVLVFPCLFCWMMSAMTILSPSAFIRTHLRTDEMLNDNSVELCDILFWLDWKLPKHTRWPVFAVCSSYLDFLLIFFVYFFFFCASVEDLTGSACHPITYVAPEKDGAAPSHCRRCVCVWQGNEAAGHFLRPCWFVIL